MKTVFYTRDCSVMDTVTAANKELSTKDDVEKTDFLSTDSLAMLHKYFCRYDIRLVAIDAEILPPAIFKVAEHIQRSGRFMPFIIYDKSNISTFYNDSINQLKKQCTQQKLDEYAQHVQAAEQYIKQSIPLDYVVKSINSSQINVYTGKKIRPTAKKLLDLFIINRGKPLALNHIMEHIWGDNSESHANTLYAYIHELRSILGDDPHNPQRLIHDKKGEYKLV